MKVVLPTSKTNSRAQFQLCIGLEPPPPRSDDDGVKPISFTCKMHPKDKNSAEFTVKIYKYGDDGTVEGLLETLKLMAMVDKGQNVKKNEERVTLFRQIFEGSLLVAFENELPGLDENGNAIAITDDVLAKAVEAIKKVVFPDKAARNQKKAMRRLKLPRNMTFRVFANRFKKMSDFLPFFPVLANGSTPTAFDEEELLECLYDSLPWENFRAKMVEHGYDPTTDTFHNFIQWVETRCEPFMTPPRNNRSTDNGNNKPIPKKKRKPDTGTKTLVEGHKDKKQKKFCMFHKYCDHTTDECKVVKASLAKVAQYNKSDKSKDFHAMMSQEEFQSNQDKRTATICSKLFKAFKSELKEEFHLMEKRGPPEDGADENDAYMKALKLNADDGSLQAPSDEDDLDVNELLSGY